MKDEHKKPHELPRFKRPVKEDPTALPSKSLSELIKQVLNDARDSLRFDEDVNYEQTILSIEKSVEFKGYNIWVLICSIAVASVGLNTNSPAVIIGAMLISPLMGPIRGVGLGVGMIDFKLIIRSLRNFMRMVIVSLITSTLYFTISPIEKETSELLGRTFPTILDVVVAFFGGLAGIIAATRGERDTVVPGVAIATALMPPLCTAGYGFALGKWDYFFGAMYLFLLNSLFICLSTVLVIRFIQFPVRQFLNEKLQHKVKMYILFGTLIVMLPSGLLFYRLVKESIFLSNSDNFYTEVIKPSITDKNTKLYFRSTYINRDSTFMELDVTHGSIPDQTIALWRTQLPNYDLDNTSLKVFQRQFKYSDVRAIESLITQAGEKHTKGTIKYYQDQIDSLKQITQQNENADWDLTYLRKSLMIDYPNLNKLSLSKEISEDNNGKRDTLYYIKLKWKATPPNYNAKKVNEAIRLKVLLLLEKQNVMVDSLIIQTE
ncbi:DUF389 domain-containing protein [Limibacter armeniacum]|uniref:DUF389 domain-containing protein n=1 Tax=Limibacter armeniacum TaxID=466084 RepID=UPI002FE6AB0E